jgi:hypothetical protein
MEKQQRNAVGRFWQGLVRSYLGESDPNNPLASPLFGNLTGLPPVRVHVGDDEVLLEDSRRYVERAVAAGVDARLDVWIGMRHGFLNGVGSMTAANQTLRAIGIFLNGLLRARLSAHSKDQPRLRAVGFEDLEGLRSLRRLHPAIPLAGNDLRRAGACVRSRS